MAQLVLEKIGNLKYAPVNDLPKTQQGSKGFGSTGITGNPQVMSADLGCNQPMVVPVQLNQGTPANSGTSGLAMIDSGASTQFIDIDFAAKHNLQLTLKPRPETLIVVDGREANNRLTHTCTLNLTIDQHIETLTFQVTKLAGWDMILGKMWLKRHNPVID